MKFRFEVVQRHQPYKAATYIVAVVIPFWAKREDSVYHRNVLTRDLQDLKVSEQVEDALFCICHFDGTELFSPKTSSKDVSIHSLSDKLVTSLATIRNVAGEDRKLSSSSADEEVNKVTSESDARDRIRLPIVFIAHSLASWVVRHLLSGAPYYNSSIMFGTRGVVFLDTPHKSFVTSPEAETAEKYLADLGSFLRAQTDGHSSTDKLAKELTVIDGAFEQLQNSAFVHEKKEHVMGGPAIATRFKEIWATASKSGLVTFQEQQHGHQKKIDLSRLRKIMRLESQKVQLESTKSGQSSHVERLDLLRVLNDIIGVHRQLHSHHYTGTHSFPRDDSVVLPETHLISSTGRRLQPPEPIPEEVEASTFALIRTSSQGSLEDSKSMNRSTSPDPVAELVPLTGQTSQNLGRILRQSRRDSTGDGGSITSERSDITQPASGALKASACDPTYGPAYRGTIKLANSYYQRAEFANAEAAFQRSKELLEAAMGSSVRQSYEFIAINEQLAAIYLYRGQYSKAKTEFERLSKEAQCLERVPSVQKEELVQDLKRWRAVVMLHQGQYEMAVREFKALLKHGLGQTNSEAQRMLRVHVLRDLSLALAHLGPYSQVRGQIGSAEKALETYSQSQDSVLDNTSGRIVSDAGTRLANSGAFGVRSNVSAPIEDKSNKGIERKLAVKRDYLRFVQAMIYYLWGFYYKSLKECEDAMLGLEERLGRRHMKTLECASLKAVLLAKNYHLSAAENCCSQTLQTMRKELGPRHPHTLEATGRLVYIFILQYRLAEAKATAASLQMSTKNTFGDNHPQSLNSQLLLSQVNLETGDYIDALQSLQELNQASKSFYGEENLITLTHNSMYARALYHAGALKKAQEIAKSTLRRQRKFFSLSNGLETNTQEVCLSSQRLIRDKLEAVDRKADDSRIHPLFLNTLETIARIELSKSEDSDRVSARGILGCCWRWKSRILAKDHPFALAAEYEFAMAFEDEDDENDEIMQRQQHMRHIYLRRISMLENTHPDVLTAKRELIIINCTLGVWRDFPTTAEARTNLLVEGDGVDDDSMLTDIAETGKTMDDETWTMAEIESQRIFSMHKMQLGPAHPETLKSHLWLFQLQVQLGRDVNTQTCMGGLLSELGGPRMLRQRLVDSVRKRHQMALALHYSGHLRQAARILHQIHGELKETPLDKDLLFSETLEQLRQATQRKILETMREAQTHPIYKTRLQELRSKVEISTNATDEAGEGREHLSEIFELCELLYGPDHPRTLGARKKLVLATWDPQNESRMREAIKDMSDLIAVLKVSSDTAQGKESTKIYDQWVHELDAWTKKAELEDESKE